MKKLISLVAGIIAATSTFAEVESETAVYRMVVPVAGISESKSGTGGGDTPSTTPESDVSEVDCGYNHCLAIVKGELFAVGDNSQGQLGLGHKTDQTAWVSTGLTGVTDIATGYYQSYAIIDGALWVVGDNSYGQLGNASTSQVSTWQQARGTNYVPLTGVSKIDANGYHAYALKDGFVYAAGRNSSGQLGIGNYTNRNVFVQTPLNHVTDIAAGWDHGLAIKDGELHVVGEGGSYQLGINSTANENLWVSAGLTSVTKIAAGQSHSYAISEGRLYAAGASNYYQAGKGGTIPAKVWTMTGPTGIEDVTANFYSGLYLKGGEVFGVGENGHGQMGTGVTGTVLAWRKLTVPGSVQKLMNGGWTNYLLADGVLYSAGNDEKGMAGDGGSVLKKVEFKPVTIAE